MSVAMWALVWKICLLVAVVSFAAMAVIVSIGGAYDVRRLLRRLAESEESGDS